MRALLWLGLILVCVIIQVTIMPLIAVNGIRPDLLLILAVSAGLLFGKEQGGGIGFFAGLIQDLIAGGFFGLNTLSKIFVGFLAGMIEQKVFKENILLPVVAMIAATLVNGAMVLVILFFFGQKIEVWSAIVHKIFPQLIYNMIVAIPVHQMVTKLSHR